jgi:hypothetical protein
LAPSGFCWSFAKLWVASLAFDSDLSAMGTTSALLQCRWLGFQLEQRIGTGDMIVLVAYNAKS